MAELWSVLKELCRGEPETLAAKVTEKHNALRYTTLLVVWIVLGSGAYGASVGIWRAPLQAVYVAVKFPLLILLTTLGNGLLNGIIALLIGAKTGFRQSLISVLMSFAIASIILGALSPLILFLVWNAPPMSSESAKQAHTLIILADVAVIAFAGCVANIHLFRLLAYLNGSRIIAYQVLFSWLAGNLLLGGQLSWIMRPFIGTPTAAVEFFRDHPLAGNFFETVWKLIVQ